MAGATGQHQHRSLILRCEGEETIHDDDAHRQGTALVTLSIMDSTLAGIGPGPLGTSGIGARLRGNNRDSIAALEPDVTRVNGHADGQAADYGGYHP